MSFFVSKDIKDIINPESIYQNTEIDYMAISLKGENTKHRIKEVEVVDDSSIIAKINTNIFFLEKLFFKKVEFEKIIIGSSQLLVNDFKVKHVKENSNTYDATIRIKIKEGLNVQS